MIDHNNTRQATPARAAAPPQDKAAGNSKQPRWFSLRWLTVFLVLFGLSFTSLFIGVSSLRTDSFWLLATSRIPRTLAPLLAGAALSVAGVVMQLLTQNRFVEPSTTGTAQSAGFGLLAISLLAPEATVMSKILVAIASAIVGTWSFLLLLRRLPLQDPLMVPLVGIIYGGIISAVSSFVAYEYDLLQYLDIWTNGEFSGVMAGRYETLFGAAILMGAVYVIADRFTIAGLGEDMSRNLGLNYRQLLQLGMLIVSAITAVTVVTIGMLPFVGLVVPNIVARIWGDNLRDTLPLVAASGAGLVLLCDIIGRVIRFPYEIPAGTIMGCLGSVVFLWLLFGDTKTRG